MTCAHDPSRKRSELPAWTGCLLLSLIDLHFSRGDTGRRLCLEVTCQMRTRCIALFSPRFFLPVLFALLYLLSACGGSGQSTATGSTTGGGNTPATPVPTALDVYGSPVVYPKTAPQHIISLAPSMSEVLAALNLQDKVVGVDYYTDYPADIAKTEKISDANGKFNIERILALKPDLILSSGGLTKTVDGQLVQHGLTVVDLPSSNIDETMNQIKVVGHLTFADAAATTVVQQMQQQIDQVKSAVQGTSAPKVLLEVDDSTPGKPYVFGGGSFGDQLLQYAMATNIFHSNTNNGGYPQVTDEAVIAANPQYIILTEDPMYGGKPETVYKRANWGVIEAVKNHHVYHLNTDILQRPGPRITEGVRCVAQVVHPDKFSGALPDYCQATV